MIQGCVISLCWTIFVVYWALSARSVKATAEMQNWAGRLAQRVPLTLGFAMFFVRFNPGNPLERILIRRTPIVLDCAAALCLLGLLGAIWARRTLAGNWSGAVTLKKGHELVKTGPYRYVRHPIYTSLLLMLLGSPLALGRVSAWVGFLLFCVGLWIKIMQEERLMLRHFAEEYRAYRAEVKALIPFVF